MIKPVFAVLIFITTSVVAFSQQVPNGTFENWTGGKPVSWDASNESVLGTTFTCVTQETTDPFSGTISVKIESVTKNIILVGSVTLPGILTLGEFTLDIASQSGEINGGLVFPYRPAKLKGWYKSQPGIGDKGTIGAGFLKMYGSVRDTIGYAEMQFPNQVTTWTPFEIDIDWTNGDVPDSMNIVASSSDIITETFTGGSKLWLDNLYFAYSYLSNESAEICDGSEALWRGNYYSVAGTYYDSLISSEGTDSVFVLNLVVNDLPTVYNVTGGGSYNQGGPGVPVGLSGSVAGILYTLFFDGTQIATVTGDGNPIDFGNQTGEGTYTVVATDPATGCINDMSGNAVVLMITGIDKKDTETISVYPNPATDVIYIRTNGILRKARMIDADGKTVWEGNETTIVLQPLPAGNYILVIETEKETISKIVTKK